tara:strand:+ start:532 stop:831 length:300 start_codon:yes stop_codon:yes gene_type:complete
MVIKVNDKQVQAMFKELDKMPRFVMEKTYPVLKSNTPIDKGNARSKTKLEKNKTQIGSRYPYADRLNTGWSKQAPNGFTEPAIDEIERLVFDQIRKIGQ